MFLYLMSRLSIQEIKACHASMVQMLSYVETVDTQRSKQSEQSIVCCVSCRDCRYKSTSCFNGSNAMLCRYSRYKMNTHVHMFLPVTSLIFNGFSIRKKFWNAENQGFPTISSNPKYVDTVDTSRNISMQ